MDPLCDAKLMLTWHRVCSLLSYVGFLIAFVSGLLFLIQEYQIKHKRVGALFHRLPSLEILDRINFLAMGIGFGLLSLGVLCGIFSQRILLGRWWVDDPKEYLTLLLWSSYLLLWLVRLRSHLRGRPVALLSILGFSLALFTCLGAGWLLASRHPFISFRGQ